MASSQGEARRAEKHMKARQQMLEEYGRQKQGMSLHAEKNRLAPSERFTSKTESIEDTLKKETVGLVSAEDFRKRREALEELKKREAAKTDELKYVLRLLGLTVNLRLRLELRRKYKERRIANRPSLSYHSIWTMRRKMEAIHLQPRNSR